jgi:opacity protein-like surface antigen
MISRGTARLLAASDVDLSLPIPVGQGTRVIPRAGGFLMIGVGRSSDAFAFGWNAGAGLVFNSEGPVLLRADYTLRSFMNPDGGLDNAMQAVSAGMGWKF